MLICLVPCIDIGVGVAILVLLGVVAMVLSPDLRNDWGYWIGTGLVACGVVIALYGSLFVLRLYRELEEGGAGEEAPEPDPETADA